MSNNTLPLVTYKQAKRLKAVGFNWPCRSYYNANSRAGKYDYPYNDNINENGCSAPTIALALKWMRDVKHITGYMSMCGRGNKKWCNNTKDSSSQDYNTYEQAESALLDELLILFENVK